METTPLHLLLTSDCYTLAIWYRKCGLQDNKLMSVANLQHQERDTGILWMTKKYSNCTHVFFDFK
ncbi:protein of unknown function [Xenorhabdus doucetiae]|uniref:Uncharacterized protein n=1 Tax=Xenorhabdus doucetiae TaxID=351671 RepID=A0A068QXI9_9GAMM|nr:protein of unknown function [Xenorhabdus doucetiae]